MRAPTRGAQRLLILSVALLLFAPATSLAAGQVALQPAAGGAGSSVVLNGSGFPASKRVVIGVTGTRSRALKTSRQGRFQMRLIIPRRKGWLTVVSVTGRSRVVSRFFVTDRNGADQVIDIASTRGQRLRISPTTLFPGSTLRLRGTGFGCARTVRLSGFDVTRTAKTRRNGSFDARLVLSASAGAGSSRLVVSRGGLRFSVAVTVASEPVKPQVVPVGVVALWHMDDRGTTMVDSVGAHNGTLHNVATGLSGSLGTAFGFNGVNSYAFVSQSDALSAVEDDVAVAIRMKVSPGNRPDAAVEDDCDLIRSASQYADGDQYKVEYNADGTVLCAFKGAAGYKEVFSDPAKPVDDGAWHTITCVKTTTQVKTIVDGVTTSATVNIGTIVLTEGIIIAAHPSTSATTGASEWFNGELDEASIAFG